MTPDRPARFSRREALTALGATGLAGVLAACGSPTGAGSTPPTRAGTPAPETLRYGADPAQYAELHLPAAVTTGALGVVVVLHGGYWQQAYGLELGTPLAVDLANGGLAALNVEYRRVGGGGGFPATLADVAAAVDLLASPAQQVAGGRLDLGRVVLLGHSAGGQLAVWAASRSRLPAGAPGADPLVRPRGTVSQAGVLDLVAAADQDLGGGAVASLLGGTPAEQGPRYALASPAALVPADAPVVAVHGTADSTVPFDQSARYVDAAARAGGRARLRAVDGADHFALIDPSDPAWRVVRDEVTGLLGPGR